MIIISRRSETWAELARKRPDGSTVLAYTQEAVDALDPEKMFDSISGEMNGTVMPGWEPERMAHVKELFEMYKDIDDEKLFANLKYFLERIMPVCNEYDIYMAIHPDDPAWSAQRSHLLLRFLRHKPGKRPAGYDPLPEGKDPFRTRAQPEIQLTYRL